MRGAGLRDFMSQPDLRQFFGYNSFSIMAKSWPTMGSLMKWIDSKPARRPLLSMRVGADVFLPEEVSNLGRAQADKDTCPLGTDINRS
jgi:hypothetical protein